MREISEMIEKGYHLVALRPGSKIPLHKGWQEREYSESELIEHVHRGGNVGVKTGECSRLVVLDIDSSEQEAIEWVKAHVGDSVMQTLTPRGGRHLYFRARSNVVYGNGVKLRGKPLDLRSTGAYAVCHPSKDALGVAYRWAGPLLSPEELPFMRVKDLRDRKRKRVISTVAEEQCESNEVVRRGKLYVARVERRAVSGNHGHTDMLTNCIVASSFVKRLGGTKEDAWQLVLHINATLCDPPWDVSDRDELAQLKHKWEEGWRLSR